MLQEKLPFPQIPQTKESLALLSMIENLGKEAWVDSIVKEKKDLKIFGAYLVALGCAPKEENTSLFCIYNRMIGLSQDVAKWYNKEILNHSSEPRAVDLSGQNEDLLPYFDKLQIVLFYINERAKKETEWEPLNFLLWGVFSSLFSTKKMKILLKEAEKTINSLKDDMKKLDGEIKSTWYN